jgi:hypothetical protein
MTERRAKSDDEYKDFMEWLDTKRYKNLIDEINTNHLLGLGIKNLLKQNQEVTLSKLEGINEILLLVSSEIDGLNEISHAIAPNIEISDQAISILKQLNDSGGSFFLESKRMSGATFPVMDGGTGNIEIKEPRFVDDDLNQLVQLGLLRLDYNSSGDRLFYFTRSAVKLVEQAI